MRKIMMVLGVAALLFTPSAAANDLGFSPRHIIEGEPLALKGTATHRLAGILKICRAALYGPAGAAGDQLHLYDVPKRLEIEYFVPVGKDRLVQMAVDSLETQFTDDQLLPFQDRIREFHKLYRDVGRSDRYAMTYHPELGLTLELNGEILGSVPGARFASTYLAIWLGDDPVSPAMKKKLLKQS